MIDPTVRIVYYLYFLGHGYPPMNAKRQDNEAFMEFNELLHEKWIQMPGEKGCDGLTAEEFAKWIMKNKL